MPSTSGSGYDCTQSYRIRARNGLLRTVARNVPDVAAGALLLRELRRERERRESALDGRRTRRGPTASGAGVAGGAIAGSRAHGPPPPAGERVARAPRPLWPLALSCRCTLVWHARGVAGGASEAEPWPSNCLTPHLILTSVMRDRFTGRWRARDGADGCAILVERSGC